MDPPFQRQRPKTLGKRYRPLTGPAVIFYVWIRDPAGSGVEPRVFEGLDMPEATAGHQTNQRPLRKYWHELWAWFMCVTLMKKNNNDAYGCG